MSEAREQGHQIPPTTTYYPITKPTLRELSESPDLKRSGITHDEIRQVLAAMATKDVTASTERPSLHIQCTTHGLDYHTVWALLEATPELMEIYTRQRRARAERYATETIGIADEATDRDTAAAAKVRVNARQWYASKANPTVYGDKIQVDQTARIVEYRLPQAPPKPVDTDIEIIDASPR